MITRSKVEDLAKRCQIGVGGRNALDKAHNIMAECYAMLGELMLTVDRMQEWLEGDCNCPCCNELRKCADGCTFAIDCPGDAERMADARMALYGT
jgi:hypothetical protein